ncbi:MAG: diacylglycerol kinase family protein [Patescibacteria group bacterium]|nr:MAG: diacylglycerol kinase family protein [Patescibacteria group bacterium]
MSRFSRLRRKPVDRIDVLTNPNAGKGKNRTIAPETLAKLVEVFFTPDTQVDVRHRETKDLGHLDRVIDEMVLKPPAMIIVIGGDGTKQKTFDRVIKRFEAARKRIPLIMAVHAGTVGAVQEALELLGSDPEKARDKIFEKIRRGRELDIIHRDVLRISGENAFLAHGFIVGFGLPVRFLERYYAYDPPRGFWCAVRTALAVCWNEFLRFLPPWRRRSIADPFEVEYELWADDACVAHLDGRFAGIIMASIEQIGLGCRLTYRAQEWPDHFHAVLSPMGIGRTLLNVPNMFRGRPLHGGATSEIVTKVVLRFKDPTPLMIDGEMYSAADVGRVITIERGPTLDFIRS